MRTTNPKNVGLSAPRLERLSQLMQRYVDQGKLAGTVTLLARGGKTAYFETCGRQDIENHKPMERDTIFRIYSMTKPITSIALMMLYEEGQLLLSDPVSKFIPAFKDVQVYAKLDFAGLKLAPLEQEITIHHLLAHTAGLTYGSFEDSPIDALYHQHQILSCDRNLAELMDVLTTLPLNHQPGSAWRYSVATDVLGRVIEIISGQSFDTFLQERILTPLGMTDTAFIITPDKADRFAALYGLDEHGKLTVTQPILSKFTSAQRLLSGGGGLISTAEDYLRFCQMLLNGGELDGTRLVSRKTMELMTANALPEAMLPIGVGPSPLLGYGFGLGFRVCVDVARSKNLGSVGEYGWSGAASTYFWVDPSEQLIGIFMTQFMPSGLYPIRNELKTLAYQAIVD